MPRTARPLFTATLLAALPVAASEFTFHVTPAPEWNHMFQRTNGWMGADVAYSVPLGADKTLWLFGDTFVGHASGRQRVHCGMIHSSIAIQPFGQAPRFFYPTDKKGGPKSFIKGLDHQTDFWLLDGARNDRGLNFFMQEVKWTGTSVWGFHCAGTWLVSIDNPDAPPAHWKISRKKLPFQTLADGEEVILGCETLSSGGYLYVYGYSTQKTATGDKQLVLARAPENEPDNFDAWEFFANGAWTKDFQGSTPIFSGVGAEGSVSWQPFLKKFIFVYSEGIWGKIVMRTADAPAGPWSDPIAIYQCPEMHFSPKVFCYAGKGHPELSATNELLISYAANSQTPSEVMNDTRLYWPRFVRVTFDSR